MTQMGVNGGMEVDDEEKKKKISEDLISFLKKRSETITPRYTARLKTYVDLQQKRRRAAAARRHSEQVLKNERSAVGKNDDNKLENTENCAPKEEQVRKRRGEKKTRLHSRSRSGEPLDSCGCRRRRRRRRSSRRRRRRSCRRRRRRSCSRRRRRRSCRRRRKRRCRRR